MIKVTVFYPVKEGDWFDVHYYLEKHMPLSQSSFGDRLKGIAIEENTASPDLNKNLVYYRVIGHLFFEKTEDFYEKFLPNEEILVEDAKRYTNVTPILQISKVLIWRTPWI